MTINPSSSIQELTPCLPEHVLWSSKRYVFGVRVVFKTVEKTHVLTMPTPNFSVDSIWHLLLVMLHYLDECYSISWDILGMLSWYVE